jgi:hypothetical protein
MIDYLYSNRGIMEKDNYFKDLLSPFLGDGLFFAPTNDIWRDRRKSITAVLYKKKLLHFYEDARKLLID